jgi:beta-lactamase regulating signal transducer with metallopeptidase domain
MNSVGLAIVWCALQVSLFLALAAVVYFAVRRLHPRTGTWAAMSSLTLVIALSALAASPWPRWPVDRINADAPARRATATPAETTTKQSGVSDESDVSANAAASESSGTEAPAGMLSQLWRLLTFVEMPARVDAPPQGRHWTTIIVALATCGIALGLARLVGGLVAVRRLVQRSRPIDDAALVKQVARLRSDLQIRPATQLRESTEVATPAAVGWRHPVILLPAEWSTWDAMERRAVLAHELSHVARRDFAAWLVARLAVVIHFYHPLVHWFAQRLQLDQELAADAAAVRLVGDRDSYLHALARLALDTPPHRIAGPARTFIPSRSLLLRRVEMLRSSNALQVSSPRRARAVRWSSLTMLACLAIAAAGLRQSSSSAQPADAAPPSDAQAAAAQPANQAAPQPSAYNFAYVPDDIVFLIALRPAEMAASPRLKPLAELLDENTRPRVPARQLEQVTFVMPAPEFDERGVIIRGSGGEYTVARTTEPIDFKPLLEAAYGTIAIQQHNGRELLTWSPLDGSIAFYPADDRTLIGHNKAGLVKVMDDPGAATPPADAAQWQAEAKGPAFATLNAGAIRGMIPRNGVVQQMLAPILDATERVVVIVEDAEPLVIRATAACRTAEDVKLVDQTLQSLIVLARNVVAAQKAALPMQAAQGVPAGSPGASAVEPATKLLDALVAMLNTVELTSEGPVLTATARIDNSATLLALGPAINAAREAARRTQSSNNLKQIALAALMYADKVGALPPAVVYGKSADPALNSTGDDAGNVPRSWRVELMPFVGHAELYKQYRLDQPWDSEANRKVLAQMPDVFRAPEDAPGSTNASYFALTGPGTVFDGREGTKFTEIRDGSSQTLLFVEAKRPIPWTKPEDIAYDPDGALPPLGGWRAANFVIAMCDGSVPLFGTPVDEKLLKALIGIADGQAVQLPRALPNANR